MAGAAIVTIETATLIGADPSITDQPETFQQASAIAPGGPPQ
jgi:hypothetical protein